MKGYKRLTDRVTAEMLRNTEGEGWDSDNIEAQCYIRLAELEDKIESGEIDYVSDKDAEIACLTAENAELRERLGKAVVNKCIYYINSVWNDATMTRKDEVCQGAIDYACDNFVEVAGLVLKWEKIYFTREAALARLAELKGEK